MTTTNWGGVTVDFELLVEYNWFNQTIVVGGVKYRLLHGYMAAALLEIDGKITLVTASASAAATAANTATNAAAAAYISATAASGSATAADQSATTAATAAMTATAAAASVSLPVPAAGDTGKWLQWSGAGWVLGIIQAATTTVAGLVRLATTAEVQTGTATNCAVTPAAGRAAYVGQGLHTIFLPATSLEPRLTAGAALLTTEIYVSATVKVVRSALAFDTATQEHAQFRIAMPRSWDRGPVSFQAEWTADGGSGGVVFGLRAMALSDGDPMASAFGTATTVSDTLGTAGAVQITATSGPVTILSVGAMTSDDVVFFEVFRNVSDPADTLAQDALLLGIRCCYTVNAATDA